MGFYLIYQKQFLYITKKNAPLRALGVHLVVSESSGTSLVHQR